MLKVLIKQSHVFVKDEKTFTSFPKTQKNGKIALFTTVKLLSRHADAINYLFPNRLEVERINFEKGFMYIKLTYKGSYLDVIEAVKIVLYETEN